MKIQLNIKSSYCPSWGVWEGLREVVQNYLDSCDEGYEGSFFFKNNQLTFKNLGVTISVSQIGLFGDSTKTGNSTARGQFGEGLKIGTLALCRLGYKVTITSGQYRWRASIEHSPEFDEDVLTFRSQKIKERNYVEISIEGISHATWAETKRKILTFNNLDRISLSSGELLTNNPGEIFVKDIYVCSYSDLQYGYNLKDAKLDRDRKIVDDFDLKWSTSSILAEAVIDDKISYHSLLNSIINNKLETSNMAFRHIDCDKLLFAFQDTYGKKSVAVKTKEEKDYADTHGLVGIVMTPTLCDIFEKGQCGVKEQVEKYGQCVHCEVSYDELLPLQKENYDLIMQLLTKHLDGISVSVVEFTDHNTCMIKKDSNIYVSNRRLESFTEAMENIVDALAIDRAGVHKIYTEIIQEELT